MVKKKIRSFLNQFISKDMTDDQDIFAGGFVNSLFATQLVLFIEENFDMIIESEDLVLDNFKSVDAIDGFISAKTNKEK